MKGAGGAVSEGEKLMRPETISKRHSDNAERRGERRRRVLKGARIVFNNRFSLLDASVRDISRSGCRIRLNHPLKLPSTFLVAFPGTGVERPAILIWQNGQEAGVKFADKEPPEAFLRLLPDQRT